MPKTSGQKKRKRDDADLTEENKKCQKKKQKVAKAVEEIYDVEDEFEENSDLSEGDEGFEVSNIEELLAPKDKELLRQDPFNQDFAATTWTNEFTLLKANSEFNKWRDDVSNHSGIFPLEICSLIASYCAPVTLFALRRVSKPMNALVVQSDDLWRTHFYSRRWKLRQDLENGFCGVEPIDEDKSEWVNVIPDDQVDWFGEYRRNHINSYFIRTLVDEITTKLQKIVDEYGVVKKDVKKKRQKPLFFEPGLTDEEVDDLNRPRRPITNDMRELLKCCSGQRFLLKNDQDDIVPPIISIGAYARAEHNYAQLAKMDMTTWYSEDSDFSSDEELYDPYPINDSICALEVSTKKFEEIDAESDSEDYEPSQLSYDSDEEERSGIEEFIKSNKGKKYAKRGVFGYHRHVAELDGGTMVHSFDDFQTTQYYDIPTGSLIVNERSYGCVICTVYPSIVDYLQEVSDFLDMPLAVFLLHCKDYDLDKSEFDSPDEHVNGADFSEGLKRWADAIHRVGGDIATHLHFTPRAVKLLVAAAQDTIVKVFQRAQELETSDELQLNTFQRAAKEVSRDIQINN